MKTKFTTKVIPFLFLIGFFAVLLAVLISENGGNNNYTLAIRFIACCLILFIALQLLYYKKIELTDDSIVISTLLKQTASIPYNTIVNFNAVRKTHTVRRKGIERTVKTREVELSLNDGTVFIIPDFIIEETDEFIASLSYKMQGLQ